jgi:hypothetical protein
VPGAPDAQAAAGVTGVSVTVASTAGTLQLETDESYTLDVPLSGPATVSAKTVFGGPGPSAAV